MDSGGQEIKKGTGCTVEIQQKPVPFFMQSCENHSDDCYVVKLKGIDSPEEAANFKNRKVGIASSLFVERQPTELSYWEGYEIKVGDQKVGIIKDVYDNSGQLLFSVDRPEDENILIPFHSDFIVVDDKEQKILTLDLPEGLLELGD